jgi:branched-chain amino acid transport system permease protein
LKNLRMLIFSAFLLALPFIIGSDYQKHILIMGGIYVILVSSLNLLIGYVGEISLGHTAFFGIGAYTSALLFLKLGVPFWLGLPAAGVMAGIFGFLIGYPTLRTRGPYFVIVTLAFCEILRLIFSNWISLTNGPMGLKNIQPPTIHLGGWVQYEFSSKDSYYYLILGLASISLYICYRYINSRYGRACMAIRENEPLAQSVGISAAKWGITTFILSTFLAGLAGSFYAHYVLFISPDLFGFSFTINMLLMLIIGGKGTMAGPVLGAVLFTIIPEYLRVAEIYRLPIFGILLMLAVIFMPRGLIQLREPISRRFKRSQGRGGGN